MPRMILCASMALLFAHVGCTEEVAEVPPLEFCQGPVAFSWNPSAGLRLDAFPDDTFGGEIISIGNSTTGSFALLPNPNPSGNFTKITQRLPVRIAIEQREQKLRPGMMVEVRIDVRGR